MWNVYWSFTCKRFLQDGSFYSDSKWCSFLITALSEVLWINRGEDIESLEMLRQGFTHAFVMTFKNKEDFTAFLSHPKHVEFSTTFSAVIEKIVLLDFPVVLAKAPTWFTYKIIGLQEATNLMMYACVPKCICVRLLAWLWITITFVGWSYEVDATLHFQLC